MEPGAVACLAVSGGAALVGAGRIAIKRWRRDKLLRLAETVTRRHARLLLVKQKQLVIHDGYGNYSLDAWIEHANYFIDNVILREATSRGLAVEDARQGMVLRPAVTARFLGVLNRHETSALAAIADEDIISGEHYETLCHNILEAAGWDVTTTPVTGDQGADLIADAGGRRVVIQCKFYSKPVGNKAVQEAAAARSFHGGDRAAVVSNAAFTRSARQLAQANGVLLLHHDQLRDLRDVLRQGTSD